MRVSGTPSRLIELRERKGRLQLESLCPLGPRDGDGSEESLLSGSRYLPVALQKYFPAQPVEEDVARVAPVRCARASASSI